jgi:hypothetical protein
MLHGIATSGEKDMRVEAKRWERSIYKDEVKKDSKRRQMSIEEIEKNIEEAKRSIIFLATYHGIPENHAEALADLLPVFINASKAFANIVDRVAREKGKSPYDMAVEMFVKDPDPKGYLDLYAEPGEIEKIHKGQVALYFLMPRISEKKSGVEEFLDSERARQLEEEVKEILRRHRIRIPE